MKRLKLLRKQLAEWFRTEKLVNKFTRGIRLPDQSFKLLSALKDRRKLYLPVNGPEWIALRCLVFLDCVVVPKHSCWCEAPPVYPEEGKALLVLISEKGEQAYSRDFRHRYPLRGLIRRIFP
jgi:hypothetical protein